MALLLGAIDAASKPTAWTKYDPFGASPVVAYLSAAAAFCCRVSKNNSNSLSTTCCSSTAVAVGAAITSTPASAALRSESPASELEPDGPGVVDGLKSKLEDEDEDEWTDWTLRLRALAGPFCWLLPWPAWRCFPCLGFGCFGLGCKPNGRLIGASFSRLEPAVCVCGAPEITKVAVTCKARTSRCSTLRQWCGKLLDKTSTWKSVSSSPPSQRECISKRDWNSWCEVINSGMLSASVPFGTKQNMCRLASMARARTCTKGFLHNAPRKYMTPVSWNPAGVNGVILTKVPAARFLSHVWWASCLAHAFASSWNGACTQWPKREKHVQVCTNGNWDKRCMSSSRSGAWIDSDKAAWMSCRGNSDSSKCTNSRFTAPSTSWSPRPIAFQDSALLPMSLLMTNLFAETFFRNFSP